MIIQLKVKILKGTIAVLLSPFHIESTTCVPDGYAGVYRKLLAIKISSKAREIET